MGRATEGARVGAASPSRLSQLPATTEVLRQSRWVFPQSRRPLLCATPHGAAGCRTRLLAHSWHPRARFANQRSSCWGMRN